MEKPPFSTKANANEWRNASFQRSRTENKFHSTLADTDSDDKKTVSLTITVIPEEDESTHPTNGAHKTYQHSLVAEFNSMNTCSDENAFHCYGNQNGTYLETPTLLPLTYALGSGTQLNTNFNLPLNNVCHTQYQVPQLQTSPRSSPSLPVAPSNTHITPFNPHLPFPDKSGNMNNSYAIPAPTLQPPSPALNAPPVFPSVHISPTGLITVLLKYDVAVELSVDRNIRVVNHRHKAVAASNSRGSSNCVYHVAAKVFQDGTKTEVEVFGERRARMQTGGILFASGLEVYLLNEKHIVPSQYSFNDMSKDSSVNLLFSSARGLTNDTLIHCDEITKNARYLFHKDGSNTIIINNIKIHQDEQGEVRVTSGPRYISTSPVSGNVYLENHFVEISVQVNWNVRVQRGSQRLTSTYTSFAVSNGEHEAGFNKFREVFSRTYNSTESDFENWLPSLTFLCDGLPQARKTRVNTNSKRYLRDHKSGGEGDQGNASYP